MYKDSAEKLKMIVYNKIGIVTIFMRYLLQFIILSCILNNN